uniref:Uncharacterized protein n=1 Tax=Rhizophora mucronata TaxID=61149 RepID=A0A2P2Q554_RHIMU
MRQIGAMAFSSRKKNHTTGTANTLFNKCYSTFNLENRRKIIIGRKMVKQ